MDDATKFAKVWRDTKIAHTALPAFAGGEATVLPAADMTDIEAGMQSIGKVMNLIHGHYVGGELRFDFPVGLSVGTNCLMHYLRKGLDAQRADDAAKRT